MNVSFVIFGVGLLLFAGVFSLGYAVLSGVNLSKRLHASDERENRKIGFDVAAVLKRSEKLIRPLAKIVPRSPEEMSRQERRLVAAGIRRRDGPVLFHGSKLVLAVLLVVAFIVTGRFSINPLLFTLLPLLLGALLPDLWLTRRIAKRKGRLLLAIPDALDLTVVCVEAGLSLDQALMRISRELRPSYPDLGDELYLYELEVNAGRKRDEALRNLGKRSDVEDLKSLVAVLVQADRFGVSVAQSLRIFAESMRTKRRQRAEERAAKMAIKMVPALVFFILPGIFVVIIGPAIITAVRHLLPALSGQ